MMNLIYFSIRFGSESKNLNKNEIWKIIIEKNDNLVDLIICHVGIRKTSCILGMWQGLVLTGTKASAERHPCFKKCSINCIWLYVE